MGIFSANNLYGYSLYNAVKCISFCNGGVIMLIWNKVRDTAQTRYANLAAEFPVAVAGCIAFFALSVPAIIGACFSDGTIPQFAAVCGKGALALACGTGACVITVYYTLKRFLHVFALLTVTAAEYLLLGTLFSGEHNDITVGIMHFTGSALILIFLFAYTVYVRSWRGQKVVPDYGASSVFYVFIESILCNSIALIFFTGLLTCYLAVHYLFFPNHPVSYKVILIVLSFCTSIVGMFLFLSSLRTDGQAPEQPEKEVQILFHRGLFAMYAVYLVILCAYVGKICITRIMPDNILNVFATIATALYVLHFFSLKNSTSFGAPLFYRFGGYLMIPILAAQLLAVKIRIGYYGLTGTRAATLGYILFVIIFVILSLVKNGRWIRFSLLAGAAIVFVLSLTGLSVIDLGVRSQTRIFESVLQRTDFVHGGHFSDPAAVSKDDKELLRGSWKYLSAHKRLPAGYCAPDANADEFYHLFGFPLFSLTETTEKDGMIVYSRDSRQKSFDVSGYRTVTHFYYTYPAANSGSKPIAGVEDNCVFNIAPIILQPEYRNQNKSSIQLDADTQLIIDDMSYEYSKIDRSFKTCNITGYVLTR